MRIANLETFVVNVPMTVSIASSFARESGTTRTVIRLTTDSGIEGYGETYGGRVTADVIARHRDIILGSDPFALELLYERLHMVPFFYGYTGYAAIAGIEMACWDIIGKNSGVPLYQLLGGLFRDTIPLTGILTRGQIGEITHRDQLLYGMAAASQDLVDKYQFTALKLKGSSRIEEDIAISERLRDTHKSLNLRIDPNGAWSVGDTIRMARRLEDIDLEYLEDPVWGLESMAAVRARTRMRLCTNMCVVRLEDVAPAIRLGAVDVIHGDPHKWGGIGPTKRLGALCSAFGIGMNMHSGGEVGISTACNLHLAAAMPELTFAIDSLYYFLVDDIVTSPHTMERGALPVPTGPGLGIEVDLAKLQFFEALNQSDGDYRA